MLKFIKLETYLEDKRGITMSIKEKIKNLPTSPGVYLMKDARDQIIYVGKAKNLKRRVQSYFQHSKNHSSKTVKLIHNINDFQYILTDTEFEAFLLECKLIQELKPFFNRKMKTPLSYSYIVIKNEGGLRKVTISNLLNNKEDLQYFGPFINKNTTERAVQGIKDFLKINCSNPEKNKTSCLNFSLGLCIGMCMGGPAVVQYNHGIDKVFDLLNGTSVEILEEMNVAMKEASEQFDFETAARYRDYINSINSLLKQEKVIGFTEENQNIIVLEALNENTVKIFFINGNRVLDSDRYELNNQRLEGVAATILTKVWTHFHDHSQTVCTKLGKNEIDEAQIIYHYLKSSNCRYFIIPEKWLDDKNERDIEKEIISLLKD